MLRFPPHMHKQEPSLYTTRTSPQPTTTLLRQRPRYPHHHLPFAESPEINPHTDDVVQSRIRALIQQQREESVERVDEQAGFDAAVHGREEGGEFR